MTEARRHLDRIKIDPKMPHILIFIYLGTCLQRYATVQQSIIYLSNILSYITRRVITLMYCSLTFKKKVDIYIYIFVTCNEKLDDEMYRRVKTVP